MLRSLNEIRDYQISAEDGLIGRVDDFYFDDKYWVVRYVVADTGDWLPGRRVLVSPMVVSQPDWQTSALPVALEKRHIENSPSIDEDRPVSRQLETNLVEYYSWPVYWRDVTPVSAGLIGARTDAYLDAMAGAARTEQKVSEATLEKTAAGEHTGSAHLRSVREVNGYSIQAVDDDIGHVEDFIVNDETWVIRYVVVDTRNWLPGGKKVLVAPEWITAVSWAERNVHVDLSKEAIENGPEFDPSAPVNREYEIRLYDFYGRPQYW